MIFVTGPGAVKFQVPTVANGMVFVAGGSTNYAPGDEGGDGGDVNCSPAAAVRLMHGPRCRCTVS